MTKPPPWNIFQILSLLTIFIIHINAISWNPQNFPNPTLGEFKKCNMKSTANICDPDGILKESDRYRLNHELNQLESRTRQDHGANFCQKKGITGAMAIAKHFGGGTEADVKAAANEMLRTWDLDSQCEKAIIIVMATEDRKFWVARGSRVPVYGNEFTEIFNQQKQYFKNGDYSTGMRNILQATWEKALSKQTGGRPSGGGRQRPQQPPYTPGGKGQQDFKMPSIPWKLIIFLLIIVIPILLCCCCIYCCCCKKSGGTTSRTPQQDIEGGGGNYPPSGPSRGGRSGGGLGGFLSGMGGAAALNGIGNLIRGKGGRGGGIPQAGGYPMDPMMGGGGTGGPTVLSTDDTGNTSGRGLYPDVSKKDEGGGGGW